MTQATTMAPAGAPETSIPAGPLPRSRLSWAAKVLALGAFSVIVAGSFVTSTRSGLADLHWPTFDGSILPSIEAMKTDRGKFYEHGHRIVAGTVGLLTILGAILFQLRTRASGLLEPRRWVRRVSIAAALTVIVLAVLGGLTVKLKLPPEVSIFHVSVAMAFLSLTTILATATGRGWAIAGRDLAVHRIQGSEARWLSHAAVHTAVAVYIQAVLGAVPRHLYDGVMPHIVWAFVVVVGVVLLATRILSKHSSHRALFGPAMLLFTLLFAQFFLGFLTFILRPKGPKAPGTTFYEATASVHLAAGALMLAVSVVLAARVLRVRQAAFAEQLLRPEDAEEIEPGGAPA